MNPDDPLREMRTQRNREMDRLRRKRLQLAALQGKPTSSVPAAPIRARLNELHRLGWSFEAIASWYGTGTPAGISLIARGTSRTSHRKFEGLARLPVTLTVHPRVEDLSWVPALGASRRVRALLASGWRYEDIEPMAGRSLHVFAGNNAPTKMRAVDWRIIAAVYEQMSAAPGGSFRTKSRALAAGYAPPWSWNNIDNPREVPSLGASSVSPADVDPVVVERILAGEWRLPATRAERLEVIRRAVAAGRSQNWVERQTNWNVNRILKEAS